MIAARLTDTDRAEWAQYARHVVPLPGRARPEVPAATSPSAAPRLRAPAAPPPPRRASEAVAIGTQPPGVDKATWQRFRTGKLPAARTLDLHGRTAQRAYHALEAFLRGAHGDRLRCVEIITGRGSGEEGGVLRRELPLWLNLAQLRPLILAAAHPHPANPGSVRLLLRRVR
ncbi:MAG: Smr/MutS family protein [Alphaproteobacteria bacterium]|nr:Smr/MutS family protein [Alphaproteobacteria bacterium]